MPEIALGVDMVTSIPGTPPASNACAMSIRLSLEGARITAITPASAICWKYCSLDLGMALFVTGYLALVKGDYLLRLRNSRMCWSHAFCACGSARGRRSSLMTFVPNAIASFQQVAQVFS